MVEADKSDVGSTIAIGIIVLGMIVLIWYVVLQESVPDPPGTVRSDLRLKGRGEHSIDFESGSIGVFEWDKVGKWVEGTFIGVDNNSGDLWLDPNGNFVSPNPPGQLLVDVGRVSGLGAVKDIPTSGWVSSIAARVGHGYVVKTVEKHIYRFYVVDSIESALTGGIIGYKIKWASMPVG